MTTFATKFSVGQVVHHVGRRVTHTQVSCEACGGIGRIHVEGRDGKVYEVRCPADGCSIGHVNLTSKEVFQVIGSGRVGKIEVNLYDEPYAKTHGKKVYEEKYMLDTTGVGTGTVYRYTDGQWSDTRLFATEDEAREFVAAANREILVPLIKEAIEQSVEAWQSGQGASPAPLDYVLDARAILARNLGTEFTDLPDESSEAIADMLDEDAGERYASVEAVAGFIYDELTKVRA